MTLRPLTPPVESCSRHLKHTAHHPNLEYLQMLCDELIPHLLTQSEVSFSCQQPLHQHGGRDEQHRMTSFDQFMSNTTEKMGLAGSGVSKCEEAFRAR